MKLPDYIVPYAVSLLVHAAALGAFGLTRTDAASIEAAPADVFHVQVVAYTAEALQRVDAPDPGQPAPESVAKPVLENPALRERPRAETAVARIEPEPEIVHEPAPRIPPVSTAADVKKTVREPEQTAKAPSSDPGAAAQVRHKFDDIRARDLVKPAYPTISRRLGHEGSVVVSFDILPSGQTANATVLATSGHPRLDKAALKAVRRSRYASMTRGQSDVRVTFAFRLEDD